MKKLLFASLLISMSSAFGITFKNATLTTVQLHLAMKHKDVTEPEIQTLELAPGKTYSHTMLEAAYGCKAQAEGLGMTPTFVVTEEMKYVSNQAATRKVKFIEDNGTLKAIVDLEIK